ncbi:MAG: hypothetical protein H7Y00_02120 [Fimbriimonadaceae bacterium]|nr:hypothetical protein [Chitinophagales bacterium]
MKIFEFIFYLGVITIIFTTFWKVITTVITSLLKDLGIDKDTSFLFFKTVGYYILVSIAALKTVSQIENAYTFTAVIYAILGTFIIYATIASNLERNRWRAVMNYERKRIQVMRYDGYLLMACIVLFIITLIKPAIADFGFHNRILLGIDTIYQTPVLKWVIGFFAFFYMLNIIFRGIKASDEVLNMIFNRKKKPVSNTSDPDKYDDNFYTEYEEVYKDEDSKPAS